MYQRDRPVLPEFHENEALYLRYSRQSFIDGQLGVAAIRFPKSSVNRASLSEPEDALFSEDGEYNGLGVVEFRASCIPDRIQQANGPTYVFFMKHVPLSDNYSHSEIWSDHEPTAGMYKVPSKTVKLEFRIRLCQRIGLEQIKIEATR
jgi:hypothetical protein